MGARLVLLLLALCAAHVVVAALVLLGVGALAGSAYLALREVASPAGALAWLGAGALVLAVGGLGLAWASRRARPPAIPRATDPTARVPSSLAWVEREPIAASVLALALGVGAARSRRVRRVVEDLLRDWPGP
jgi:hypothetical protein